MNSPSTIRLLAAVVFCLCASSVRAQEPPPDSQTIAPTAEAAATPPAAEPAAPPPAEPPAEPSQPEASAEPPQPETPVEPPQPESPAEPPQPESPAEAAPATAAPEAAPAAADTQAPRPGVKRIVMLPVEFTVYQKSVAGIEAVPDWTENAKFALSDASVRMLQQDNRFEVMPLPEFDGDTQGLLREHVELFKIIGNTVTSLLQYGGKAWAEKRTNFDYTLGDGLRFLADASGADYAFLLAGAQVAQSGGAVFLELLIAAAGGYGGGGGTFVFAGIVDLHSGDVKWFNHRTGAQVFGMTGTDLRKPETAQEVVTQMFAGFPESKLVKFPPF